jgi:HEAT repeat protein
VSPASFRRLAAATWILLGWSGAEPLAANLDALAADGLYTWRVAATSDAPCWCCVSWSGESPVTRACDLDSRNVNYSTDNALTAGGEMQIYALIESGKTKRIRTLSPDCAVTSRRDLIDLGEVAVDESLAWLKTSATSSVPVNSDALAAIAVHKGTRALRFLVDMAEDAPTMDMRKHAIFWMAQARITESADELEGMIFGDEAAGIRRHAAFAWSQSTAKNRHQALIRQGREDEDAEVRSQAWFWLAQTGASQSEEEIRWAMANDPDEDVRREAVFALSQLPGERGIDALFAVLRDQGVSRDVREQALFWLAQSDSDRAFEYLDRLLADQ